MPAQAEVPLLRQSVLQAADVFTGLGPVPLSALNDCPNASAYHFLAGLDLGPHRSRGGLNIDELLFTQGDHPGSHYTAVEVTSAAALSCLHHRLAELGHEIPIEIVE